MELRVSQIKKKNTYIHAINSIVKYSIGVYGRNHPQLSEKTIFQICKYMPYFLKINKFVVGIHRFNVSFQYLSKVNKYMRC